VEQNLGTIWNTNQIRPTRIKKNIDTMGYIQELNRNISAVPKVSYDRLRDTTQTQQDGNKWNKDFTIMELNNAIKHI
jgi:hypothetical protein